MAQRLVLDVENVDEDDSYLTITNLKKFLEKAEEFGLPGKERIKVSVDTGTAMFYVVLPDSAPRVGRRVVRVKKTKKQEQLANEVKEQIAQHREDVKAGKKVAHVPPVKGTVKKKPKKRKVKKADTAPKKQSKQESQEGGKSES